MDCGYIDFYIFTLIHAQFGDFQSSSTCESRPSTAQDAVKTQLWIDASACVLRWEANSAILSWFLMGRARTLERESRHFRWPDLVVALWALTALGSPAHAQNGATRSRALIVNAPGANLPVATQNVSKMRDFLVDPKGAGLNPTDVLLLNGKDASNAAIRIGVSETLAGQSGSGLAYLYFAGHVVATSEGEAYLQAADTDLALLRTTGYPLRSLDQMLGATKGAVVLLMDLAGDSIDGQFSSLAAHGSVAAGLIAANSGFTAALSTKLAGLPATGPLTAGMLFEGLVLPSSVKRIGTNPSLVLASRPAPTPPSNPGGLTTISTTPAQQTPITGLLAEADGLRRAKKWQEAIAKYDEILAKAPDNSAAQGGRDEASRSQLAEASAQVADAKLRSTLNSAAADLTGGRYAEAELLYRDVLRQDGANRVAQDGLTEAILGQARALVKKESPDDALRLLAQLDTRNKQVSGLKVQALAVRAYLAGLSALGSRNWSEAIRDFGALSSW